jgi:hypothetical protein
VNMSSHARLHLWTLRAMCAFKVTKIWGLSNVMFLAFALL